MSAKARRLKEQGLDVVSFSTGEPDFDTPSEIVDAAINALRGGATRYTATPGIAALRQAISEKLARDNGVGATPEQIVVSTGAKQCLYNSLMTLVEAGDEVIVFAPYWMTYLEQIALAGGTPVIVESSVESGYVPTREAVRAAITPRTRAVIVNSPSNPSGAVYPPEFLRWLAEETEKNSLWLISDEIYEKLIYDQEHLSLASLGDSVAARTVTINGCSKSFAMTGWRIGYAAAPLEVAKAMSNLQDQVTSNATAFAQAGALAALTSDGTAVETMRQEFLARRDLVVAGLTSIPGVVCPTPLGAFYAFPKIPLPPGMDDLSFADRLLEEDLVATVPGSVFGAPGHLRLSYATSRSDIEKGLDRLAQAISRIEA